MTLSDPHVFCPDCGYDLRSITSDRCPECGLSIEAPGLTTSRIPWTYRKQIGRPRAFWRTCWTVVSRPAWLAGECARPVKLADALAFRRAVVITAMIGIAPCVIVAFIYSQKDNRLPLLGAWADWLFVAVIIGSIALFLLFATGVGSYFCHPRTLPVVRQNRAIALSYYACGPLAFIPLLPLFTLLLAISAEDTFTGAFGEKLSIALGILVFAVAAFTMLTWLRATVTLIRRTTDCETPKAFLVAACLPVLWGFLAAITVFALPAAFVFVALVLQSRK